MGSKVSEEAYEKIARVKLDEVEGVGLCRGVLVDIGPRKLEDALRNQCRNCKGLRRVNAKEGEVCC